MQKLEVQAFNLRDEGRIYLDHNATAPLAAELVPQIHNWLMAWGNPSSIHFSGRGPKALIREARKRVADIIHALPQEIIFTSGGSEANNLALIGAYREIKKQSGRNEIFLSAVEHPSVRETVKFLEDNEGVKVYRIPVSREGKLNLEFLEKHLSDKTALVSVMLANNETGVIHPLKKIVPLAKSVGAFVHTDAVQALGKISFDVKKLDVDLATFSGHKFYALKGSGVLYVKRGTPLSPLIFGGPQERHRRAGTENVLAIASLGYMCGHHERVSLEYTRLSELRNSMESKIKSEIEGVRITGESESRLPNTSSLVIEGVDGESLLMNLDILGVSVSTGAACSSGAPEPSPVLLNMGLTRVEAQSSLRISLGWGTTPEDIERFIVILKKVVRELRSAHKVKPLEVNL
jgi:cysteine desulfurase